MKSELINLVKRSGFIRTSSEGAMYRFLKPDTHDFSLGFLIGKAGWENTICVQWGLIHHSMWELQQDVEGIRDINIQFLLFSETIHPGIEKNGRATSLDFDVVSTLIKHKINFMEESKEKIVDDVVGSLKSYTFPVSFSSEKDLLLDGMAHYYGLLYKYLRERVSVDEIDSHVDKLVGLGLSKQSIPIFRMGLLRSYVGN